MESNQRRWQDWTVLTLGVWLFFAPFLMAYGSIAGAAAWDSYVIGAVAALFAASALWRTSASQAEEWVNLVLGLWLVAAPFALGFYTSAAAAAWNQIVVGVLIAAAATWALAERPAGGGMHAHHH